MKKLIVPFLLVFMPVLILAGVFGVRNAPGFDQTLAANRAWRLSQQIISYKVGGEWMPQTRVIPFYNAVHPAWVDSLHMDAWDEENSEWLLGMMNAYLEYNAAGRIVSNTINMNFFGMIIPVMMETATYDVQNRITHLYIYYADPEGPIYWVPSFRLHLIYGTGNGLEVYGWEEGDMEQRPAQYFHSTFSADGMGRVIEDIGYLSPDSTNWVQDYKDTYQYHPQDTSTGAEFIEHLSANLPMMMMNDGYELPGAYTEVISYYWDSSAWQLDYRSTFQYDAQIRRTERFDEYYGGDAWYPDYKRLYYYGANGQPSYTIGQMAEGGNLVDDERYDYTWEQYGSPNDDPAIPAPRLELSVYPSPFRETLTILPSSDAKGDIHITIYNLRGQSVKSFDALSGQSIVWDGTNFQGKAAPSGIYFIRASQNGHSVGTKTIRLK